MKTARNFNKMAGLGIVLLGMVALSSCLKSSKYYIDFSQGGGSVDLPLAASTSNGVTAFSYPPTVTTVTLPIMVNVASPGTPSKATNITLALDTAGLSAYNANNGTAYVPMPDSVFQLSSYNVTVPAGKRIDSVMVTIQLNKLDLTQPYVLPVTIASASLPIEQWNHLFYYVSVKNQYDGIYNMTGYTLRAGDNARTGNFSPVQMALITSGSNSVTFGSLQVWADGSGVGIGNPTLTVDNSNKVTITSPAGAKNDPGYTSYYDPSTQTFYISFTWGAGPAFRLATDTLTYLGPR
jgi:hypothetical protein